MLHLPHASAPPRSSRTARSIRRLAAVTTLLLLLVGTGSALAADPERVTFTLEGCRLATTTTLPNADGDYVCSDDEYTTGNLGKNWNELDLVPFRLTADNGNGAQTYTVVIALDNFDAGAPGYDVISAPVLNEELSSGECSIVVGEQETLEPGVGGIDSTIYRELTITQGEDSVCVFDYYGRLALGSHLFPGSSLHANLLNEAFGTAGVGARDVSIPVKEILPQQLSKTMQATQGSAYTWDLSKDSTPVSRVFRNTCDPAAARSAPVTITVRWTRYEPSPSGDITVTTQISIQNPAHRAITANVTDTVYSGNDVVTPVSGTNPHVFAPTVVAANSTQTLTHSITVPAGTTGLRDVATATYTDLVTGVPIPGETTATATANVETSNAFNQTATIRDLENITGTGLSFSVDSVTGAPAGSAFTSPAGYTLGDSATSVDWQSGVIDPGSDPGTQTGTITFQKTIRLDQGRDTSGTLSDVATLVDSAGGTATANASTDIEATRDCARLTVRKVTVPAGADRVFDFTPSASLAAAAFGLRDGEARDFGDLAPGSTHSVVEGPADGYRLTGVACDDDDSTGSTATRTATARLAPNEHVTCTFTNTRVDTSIAIVKTGSPDVVHDGDRVTFTYAVSNPDTNNGSVANVTVTDDKCADVEGPVSKTGGNQDDLLDPGETWTFTCTTTAQHADEDSGGVITNVATVTGIDEFGDLVTDEDDDTTRVIHPAIDIDKTGPATAQAGDRITYTLVVTNTGDTPFAAATVVVNDPRCDGAPSLVSRNGDASPGSLDPGDRWTYTCTVSTNVGDTAVHNVGTVTGIDELDRTVTDTDDANTTLTQPEQAVLPEVITAGTAALAAPTRCPTRAFHARVRGSKIATVTFILDGKRVKRLRAPNRKGTFALKIRPNRMSDRTHRLAVRVTFDPNSNTRAKTLRYAFKRCARQAIRPKFTG